MLEIILGFQVVSFFNFIPRLETECILLIILFVTNCNELHEVYIFQMLFFFLRFLPFVVQFFKTFLAKSLSQSAIQLVHKEF